MHDVRLLVGLLSGIVVWWCSDMVILLLMAYRKNQPRNVRVYLKTKASDDVLGRVYGIA